MPRILIVEDDQQLAQMVASFLEFEGHTVCQCHTGQDGLKAALAQAIDLLILDWDLPDLSGLELLERYREVGLEAPVIMLTGRTDPREKEAGLDSGADDYVTKPFKMNELGARVRAQLRRLAKFSNRTFILGDIAVNRENQTASRNGFTYPLSAPQYKLLEVAARFGNLKLSEVEILAGVNQEGQVLAPDQFHSCLVELRQRVDPDCRTILPHIQYDDDPDQGEKQLTGTILDGKYLLLDTLGGGGSSLVFKAKHKILGNTVALKLLLADAYISSEAKARFEREARINGSLRHPHIVEVKDFGIAERGQPYLAMELIIGSTLNEYLEKRPTPPFRDVLEIMKQTCQALGFAHSHGIVHRDVKPTNIIVEIGANGDLPSVHSKLLDFGLARPVSITDHKITITGHIVGSAPYMSPEQCRGEKVDHLTDIYALGCTFYEAVHGDIPFPGNDAVSIILCHLNDTPPVIDMISQPPQVNSFLTEVLHRCLAKDKGARFQSAQELEAAFDRVLELLE